MNRRMASVSLTLCTVILVGATSAQKTRNKSAPQPTEFYADADPDPFADSVPLPANVVDALRVTEEAKLNQDRISSLDREGFVRLFKAVEIHPAGPKELDYLVLGLFPMTSADGDWFWLVRAHSMHPQVLLFASGNGIELSRHRTNGYRNIRSVWSSAAGYTITRVYKFDGKKYRLWKEFQKTIKVG